MANVTQIARCKTCRELLDESPSLLPEQRLPCPNCGSLARHFEGTVSATANVRGSLGLKARHSGVSKPFLESKLGWSFYRKAKQWFSREMLVDRENDKYKELVTNPETGEVIHHCEEPLSQHRGHGSARKTIARSDDET
jgi:hypothetical protein